MKSIFASKTFWLNIIGIGVNVSGILAPKYAMPTLAILNIANRFITVDPVSLFGN